MASHRVKRLIHAFRKRRESLAAEGFSDRRKQADSIRFQKKRLGRKAYASRLKLVHNLPDWA